ncbi:MAG: hypothetical protein IJ997_01130 [Mycoplasmataceae bacterium]|nr:hypothetical protein [Mycoplasmataceae bacterium]
MKSKKINIYDDLTEKIIIGNFYSNDRFYTLLNEYIDYNLKHKSKLLAFIIKILFSSDNFKHDSSIANNNKDKWIRIFDWFCIICLIIFISLAIGVIGTAIPLIINVIKKADSTSLNSLIKALMAIGIPGIIFGIPGIIWLIVYFGIRNKNKILSLQAYVEKKISWCLKLKFLIKNIKKIEKKHNRKTEQIFLLDKCETQTTSFRWVNIQLINLICSIFKDFNYVFRFSVLTDEELIELKTIIQYDFWMIEIVEDNQIKWNEWKWKNNKKYFFHLKRKK